MIVLHITKKYRLYRGYGTQESFQMCVRRDCTLYKLCVEVAHWLQSQLRGGEAEVSW
jgi:hypothetical protein